MHIALIRVIDKTRMLDQDMIRLQQKVNVVLEYRSVQKILEQARKENELEQLQQKVNTVKTKKEINSNKETGNDK
jgi:chorismate-pyruvate lyase